MKGDKFLRRSTQPKISNVPVALAVCVLAFGICAPGQRRRAERREVSAATRERSTKSVSHEGMSLTYDAAALGTEVRAETVAASPLEQATDKPVGVYPRHVAFTLTGAYPERLHSYISPVVRVCPVAEYKQAFAASEGLPGEAEQVIRRLRRLLRTQPASFKGEVPSLPFADGHTPFRAHTKYLRFKNGTGIVFLAQGQQDEGLINNQKLAYEFRGLTDDGLYYVTAEFPVAAPFLPDSIDATSFEGYSLPYSFWAKNRARLVKQYGAYISGVKVRLEKLPPAKFQPNLKLLDKLLSSLEVRK